MNEQIRKLAIKSGIDIRGNLTGNLFIDEKPNVFDLAKFAELIVKECAGIVDGYYYKPTEVANLIRKHFGVE